jgi:RNA polymerase sigma-70 factor (ECF subfamily)
MMDDETLLQAARIFDPVALRIIFDSHAPALYNYALRLCQDPIEADSIVGDVFAHLLEYLKKGKGPRKNLRAYLYQITYHVIVDRARENQHFISFEATQLFRSDGSSVAAQVEDRAMMDTLMKVINTSLTLDQRHVILLRFVEDFSLSETAAILGKSVNNIKVIENRGIKKLRQILGNLTEDRIER